MYCQKATLKISWALMRIIFFSSLSTFILVDASITNINYDTSTISAQNNSTVILDRACQKDLDCDSGIGTNTSTILGNYACVDNKCKYVVAAGEQCTFASDCAASVYYIRTNQTVNDSLCSPSNCNLNSKCDSAWDPQRFNSPSQSFSGFMCCGGIVENDKCLKVATNVDPCDYDLNCGLDNQSQYKCVRTKNSNVMIGVVICLVGGIILNVGLNIQKYAFTKHQEKFNEQKLKAESVVNEEPIGKGDEFVKQREGSSMSLDTEESAWGTGDNIENYRWYKKLEKFMFWKQIVVSPLWTVGFLIYLFGTMLGFTALQFAPQSLIAPLGAISLITNLLIAPILHSQRLTLFDIFGVVIIIGGSAEITVFSGTALQDYKLCVLIALFKRPSTIIYLGIIACFIAVLIFFIKLESRNVDTPNVSNDIDEELDDGLASSVQGTNNNNMNRNSQSEYSIQEPFEEISIHDEIFHEKEENRIKSTSASSSLSLTRRSNSFLSIALRESTEKNEKDFDNIDGSDRDSVISDTNNKSILVKKRGFREKFMLPIAYAVLASSMATLTTLFAKSLINLLTQTLIHHNNQFDNPISWIILIVTLVTAVGQVYWLNIGLKKYDALIQVPIFFCNWSIYDIIGGGIYYDEFRNFTIIKYFGFSLGVAMIFFGVALLSKRLAKLSEEEEELNAKQKSIEMEIKRMKRNRGAKNEGF